MSERGQSLPVLTNNQTAVLASLIEIQFTRPDIYPCPVDDIISICQKACGDSVMEVTDTHQAITQLIRYGLISVEQINGQFTYQHQADTKLRLGPAQQALMVVLMLHGPLSLTEILDKSQRLYPFQDHQHIAQTLKSLQKERAASLITTISPNKTHTMMRYHHRLDGSAEPDSSPDIASETAIHLADQTSSHRLDDLETRITELETIIKRLP